MQKCISPVIGQYAKRWEIGWREGLYNNRVWLEQDFANQRENNKGVVLLCAAVFSVILFCYSFLKRVGVKGVEDVEEVYRWSQHCARIRTRLK